MKPQTAAVAVACVVVGAVYAFASAQDASVKPRAGTTKPETNAENLEARWNRLCAEYVKIAAPLVATLDRDAQPVDLEPVDLKMQTLKADGAYQDAKSAREIAEINVRSYHEGTVKKEQENAETEILEATMAVERAEGRQEQAKAASQQVRDALAGKGNLSASEIAAGLLVNRAYNDEVWALFHGKKALKEAKAKKEILTKYTQKARLLELKADFERKRSEELGRQADWDLAKDKEERAKRQRMNGGLSPDEQKALTLLAESVRPPASRDPAEMRASVDRMESKLEEARKLTAPTRIKRDREWFSGVASRVTRSQVDSQGKAKAIEPPPPE